MKKIEKLVDEFEADLTKRVKDKIRKQVEKYEKSLRASGYFELIESGKEAGEPVDIARCLLTKQARDQLGDKYCVEDDKKCAALEKAYTEMKSVFCPKGEEELILLLTKLLNHVEHINTKLEDVGTSVEEASDLIDKIDLTFIGTLGGSLRQIASDFITPLSCTMGDKHDRDRYISNLKSLIELLSAAESFLAVR